MVLKSLIGLINKLFLNKKSFFYSTDALFSTKAKTITLCNAHRCNGTSEIAE